MGDLLTLGLIGIGAYLFLKKNAPSGSAVPPVVSDVLSEQYNGVLDSQIGLTQVGANPAVSPATVQSVVAPGTVGGTPLPPGPVEVTDVPSTNISDYGGVMNPVSGPQFEGTQEGVQQAYDYILAGYFNDIAPTIQAGDIPNFLSLYYTIYDPDRNPQVYAQAVNTPQGQQVYDYYQQILDASPGLTKDGIMMFYSVKDIWNTPTIDAFKNYVKAAYAQPNANKPQMESWFSDLSFLTAPNVSPAVTWDMATGFLNHLGQPYIEGTDTYAYWQETDGKWFRSDLNKNIIQIPTPPWLVPVSPFSPPGGY